MNKDAVRPGSKDRFLGVKSFLIPVGVALPLKPA